jgi:GcrA cell cycle regulator
MNWTAERVTMLKKLCDGRLSASQIAWELGGDLTRSAVCGKANRLGLTINGGHAGGWNAGTRVKKVHLKKPPSIREQFEAADLPPEDATEAIDFMALGPNSCRWPIGNPPTLKFCGKERIGDLPYCPGHCRMAYVKPANKSRTFEYRNFQKSR